MAFSENVKRLVIALCNQGQSPNDVIIFLEKFTVPKNDDGYKTLSESASQLSVLFTRADWEELLQGVPDSRTIERWIKRENGAKNNRDIKQNTANNDATVNSRSPHTMPCMFSPDGVDVTALKKMGVPAKEAPNVLLEWDDYHREGLHDCCKAHEKMFEDIRNGIPFEQAFAMMRIEARGIRFDSKKIRQDVSIARRYHPWESTNNQVAAFKAMEDIEKSHPNYFAKQRHVGEVVALLSKLQCDVETAITINRSSLRNSFNFENPLNDSVLIGHCHGLEWALWDIKRDEIDFDDILHTAVKELSKGSPIQTGNFAESAILSAIKLRITRKLPNFVIRELSPAQFKLTIAEGDCETDITTGSKQTVETVSRQIQIFSRKLKNDRQVNKLIAIRRQSVARLPKLAGEIKKEFKEKNYTFFTCPSCPDTN